MVDVYDLCDICDVYDLCDRDFYYDICDVYALVACWCRQVMAQSVTLRATEISLVLMHSGIVNGYQLLCDAHTVLEPHRGTAAFSI